MNMWNRDTKKDYRALPYLQQQHSPGAEVDKTCEELDPERKKGSLRSLNERVQKQESNPSLPPPEISGLSVQCKKFSLIHSDLQTATLITADSLLRLPKMGEKVNTKKDVDRNCVFLDKFQRIQFDSTNIY